ncbi:MAG: GNAT family N-acetyltransferase [Methanomassiliicoccales archaeon]|nr:GNAT family N-acetyltransferase [Methanomassiliicoccales archaeon]
MVSVIDSLDEFKDYHERWETLRQRCGAPVFVSSDLVGLWLANYQGTVKPQLVVAEDGGDLVGAAPLCTYRHSVAGLPVRTLTLVGNGKGIIGYSLLSIMSTSDDLAVKALVQGVRKANWNLLQLFDLEPSPQVLRFLDVMKEDLEWQPYAETNNIFYEYPPDGSVDARFGRHTRKILRGVKRKLTEEGRLRYSIIESPDEAERAMRVYVQQHIERWESKGGSIFKEERNARMLVEMARLFTGRGQGLVIDVLIDGEVAGQAFTISDGDVVRGYRLGMSNKFADFSPGKLAMVAAMEETRRRGFKGMDLLRGKEEYKMHMMTQERTLSAIQAQRGALNMMSKFRGLPPVKRLDAHLHVRERMLKRIYQG